MARKAVFLTVSDLAEEFGMDNSVFGRGDYVNDLVENPENPLPYFYVRGVKLFRVADVDAWAAREIQRQNAKANETE